MSEERREEQHEEAPASRRGSRPHEPEAAEVPETPTPAPVEALLGLQEYQLVMPRRASEATTKAAQAALQRWMQLHGHDTNGFYSLAQWQEYYTAAMQAPG